MNLSDEGFDDLMRRSDPASAINDSRSDAEITAAISRITDGAPVLPHPAHKHRWPWLVIPAAAAVAIVAVVLAQGWHPIVETQSAAAGTPPLLDVTPSRLSLEEALDGARQQLAEAVGDEAVRRTSSEGWYIHITVDGVGPSTSVIAPEDYELAWNEDLSGTLTVIAGTPYPAVPGAPTVDPDDTVPPPGTVLRHETYAAGTMPVFSTSPPPNTAEEMKSYLSTVMGVQPDGGASDYAEGVRALLQEWTLSNAQQSAVLELLGSLPGLELAGTVTDRLGRPGVAFLITSRTRPEFQNLLIVSSETGRILAFETIYLGGIPDFDIPTPAVVDYVAWK